MATANITPPTVLASVDYSSGKTDNDIPLVWADSVRGYPASAAVAAGDAVSVGAPTATAPLTVHPSDSDTASDEATAVGIALNDAAVGEIVEVADIGYVKCVDASIGEGIPLATVTAGTLGTGIAYSAEAHVFVALGEDIANFYGSTSAVLAKFVGV